jgi:hypothetical protein
MDFPQQESLKDLRKKVHAIMNLCDTLRTEKDQWVHEKKELTEKLKIKEKEYIEIEHRYDLLKVSKMLLTGSEEAQDAKHKVNRIVREIDKCIALLNR